MFMPTIFLSFLSRVQEHTNPTTLMDAKQEALTIFLFVLSVSFVFGNLRAT